jgi:SAM-dependent methyltransferase
MQSAAMAQNIYDRPEFFAAYSQMRRSVEGLDGAAEWPAMRALLPDVRGLSVVDLGCGFGWFCRWAREQGAAKILGMDVSEKMLARARQASGGVISYERADLEQVALPIGAFDLAYSSLAFHYVENLERLLAQTRRSLKPGGRLVFSIEHPIYMTPSNPGWAVSDSGVKTWPIDGYLREGPRTTNWLAEGVVKHHRTLGTTLNTVIRSGFIIDHVEEFRPTPQQLAERPELSDELERPMFLLVGARVAAEAS